MTKKDYSEDLLIQAPTAELLEHELRWTSVLAYNDEGFGPDSLLGRTRDAEVVLTREVTAVLNRLNPGLPEEAYALALAMVVQDDDTKTSIALNEEKYKLLREGVPVKYRATETSAAGHLVDKRLFANLPASAYDADEISLKAGAVFAHIYSAGLGGSAQVAH